MASKLPTVTDAKNVPRIGRARSLANLRKGGGRPKGVANKTTKAIKDMILAALDAAGGEAYLTRQAHENPTAFLALLGKVLPTEVTAEAGVVINVVTGVPHD